MARPKKTELSAAVGTLGLGRKRGNPGFVSSSFAVGTLGLGRKRGNPDFVSSSFYVPKKVNLQFDRAILTLKAHGFELDRSDVLSVLMDRFAIAVDAEEQLSTDGDSLHNVLEKVGSGSVAETAGLTYLKGQLQKAIDDASALVERYESAQAERDAANQEMVSCLVALIPDENREKVKELISNQPR